MIFLIFQLMDLLTAAVLVMGQFDLVSTHVYFYHSSYLIVKGIWFWKDPFSWIDGIAGLYLVLMMFGVTSIWSYIFAGYFLYKLSLYLVYS